MAEVPIAWEDSESTQKLRIKCREALTSVLSRKHLLSLFSHWVMSQSLWPRRLQHTRLLFFTVSQSLLRFTSTDSVMPPDHLILCHPLLLSVFPSITVFSSESVLCIRWPKYCSFSISPSNEYSGLISFRIDLFGLLAAQRILKSPLQHCSSKPSILWHTAFLMVSHIHTWLLEKP